MSIIFVGGFGASTNYSKRMCIELQRLSICKVYNFSLMHGCSLEEECANIISALSQNIPLHPYILIGFSTGCLIVMCKILSNLFYTLCIKVVYT